jgi:hypothetical protein
VECGVWLEPGLSGVWGLAGAGLEWCGAGLEWSVGPGLSGVVCSDVPYWAS